MDHPCRGSARSVRRIRRSSVPWRRSSFGSWLMMSVVYTKQYSVLVSIVNNKERPDSRGAGRRGFDDRNDGKSGSLPRLKTTLEVTHVRHAGVEQTAHRQRRRVALVAHDDPASVLLPRFGDRAGARGIEPPLEMV